MLSAILKYAPLAVFALLAWLYVSLNEDVTALRQENTAIEHALKQQATLLEATEKEFTAWKERNEHMALD